MRKKHGQWLKGPEAAFSACPGTNESGTREPEKKDLKKKTERKRPRERGREKGKPRMNNGEVKLPHLGSRNHLLLLRCALFLLLCTPIMQAACHQK
jgi:hypothetical protein